MFPLHIVSFIFAIIAVGLCGAALGTPQWYTVEMTGFTYDYGLFQYCTNSVCNPPAYTSFTSPLCTRTGDNLRLREKSVLGVTIAGGGLTAIAGTLTIAAGRNVHAATAIVVVQLLGFAALATGIGLYPFVYHDWYYCDQPFCDYAFSEQLLSGNCSSFFGYSYALAIVAAACALTAFIFDLIHLCRVWRGPRTPPAAKPQLNVVAAADSGGSARSPSPAVGVHGTAPASIPNVSSEAPAAPNQNIAGMEGWEFDPSTGLYWSDVEKLFFDPNSGHFYDPESELWYDPGTEQWYQGTSA